MFRTLSWTKLRLAFASALSPMSAAGRGGGGGGGGGCQHSAAPSNAYSNTGSCNHLASLRALTSRLGLTLGKRRSSIDLYDYSQRRIEAGVTRSF